METNKEPTIPIGKFRCGFTTSSAVVETASKPIYAKNINEAPFATPNQPNGINGCQLLVSICVDATTTNIRMTNNLIPTIALLKRVLERTPQINNTLVTEIIPNAKKSIAIVEPTRTIFTTLNDRDCNKLFK